ncbi:hypothetical protein CLOM_g13748, partial [Closterium sp. NIES-68]
SVRRVHTPARRIARAYAYVRVHEADERVGGVARVAVTALTLASQAAADDAARLLFWWSNTAMLREAIASIAPTEVGSDGLPSADSSSSSSSFPSSDRTSSGSEPDSEAAGSAGSRPGKRASRGGVAGAGAGGEGGGWGRESWGSAGTLVAALRRLEEWQHDRCLELVWRKVFLPALRRPPTSPPSSSFSSSSSTLSAASSLFSSLASAATTSASSLAWPGGQTVSGALGGALGLGGQKKPAAPLAGGVADAERAPWWSKLVGVERWRAVLHEASFALCPQRAMGRCCGCVYLLEKQVLEHCLLRLDTALFNALLRPNPDVPPSDPLADPITEPAALPFCTMGKLTYSNGMHLKYATSAWSTLFHDLDSHVHAQLDHLLASSHTPNHSAPHHPPTLPPPPPFSSSVLATTTAFWAGALDPSDPSPSSSPSFPYSSSASHPASPRFPPSAAAAPGAAVAVTGGPGEYFPKLRAMAQVLLLPKDLLKDQQARKEVCGDLSVALVRRILVLFAPDASAPDAVSTTLLQLLNSEVHSESRRAKGNPSTDVAPLPPTPYTPPPSPSLRLLLGSVRLLHLPHPGASGLALDRGYESEEELRLVESPSDLLAHMIAQLGGQGTAGAGGAAGNGAGNGGGIGKGAAGSGGASGKGRVFGHRDTYKSSGYQLLADVWSRQAASNAHSQSGHT